MCDDRPIITVQNIVCIGLEMFKTRTSSQVVHQLKKRILEQRPQQGIEETELLLRLAQQTVPETILHFRESRVQRRSLFAILFSCCRPKASQVESRTTV